LFIIVYAEEDFLRDCILELEMKNELLIEKLADMRIAISTLDKKFRKFKSRHLDCKKQIILYRWIFFYISVFCCEWHLGCTLQIRIDCIRSLDDCV